MRSGRATRAASACHCLGELRFEHHDELAGRVAGFHISVATATITQQDAVRVVKDPAVTEFDEPTFAKLAGVRYSFADSKHDAAYRARMW
jgi:hypothetical protein